MIKDFLTFTAAFTSVVFFIAFVATVIKRLITKTNESFFVTYFEVLKFCSRCARII